MSQPQSTSSERSQELTEPASDNGHSNAPSNEKAVEDRKLAEDGQEPVMAPAPAGDIVPVYPSSPMLALIFSSLATSMFLVALDMVSCEPFSMYTSVYCCRFFDN